MTDDLFAAAAENVRRSRAPLAARLRPRTIDDVPILALTLHSAVQGPMELRRLGAELQDAVKQIPLVAETTLIGGLKRQIRILLASASAESAATARVRAASARSYNPCSWSRPASRRYEGAMPGSMRTAFSSRPTASWWRPSSP